jgi:hypothetical protein
MLLSVDRYATHPPEENTEGPEKPFFLHQEIALHAFGSDIELTD